MNNLYWQCENKYTTRSDFVHTLKEWERQIMLKKKYEKFQNSYKTNRTITAYNKLFTPDSSNQSTYRTGMNNINR